MGVSQLRRRLPLSIVALDEANRLAPCQASAGLPPSPCWCRGLMSVRHPILHRGRQIFPHVHTYTYMFLRCSYPAVRVVSRSAHCPPQDPTQPLGIFLVGLYPSPRAPWARICAPWWSGVECTPRPVPPPLFKPPCSRNNCLGGERRGGGRGGQPVVCQLIDI